MAFVNHADEEFSGRSRVYDYSGKTLISLGAKDEGVLTVPINSNANTSYHLRFRRPELYFKN